MSGDFYEQLATWSQIAGSIAFIVVLVVLWNKYLTPAVAASEARKNAELLEAEKRRDAEKDAVVGAQREAALAGGEAQAIADRAAREAKAESERILAEAKADGERVVLNAEGELERSRSAARARLRDELLGKALEIARSAAAKVDDATNERIVSGTIETLERGGGR